MDNTELLLLLDELDELSTWLWMEGSTKILSVAIKLDEIINNYRPTNMLGD